MVTDIQAECSMMDIIIRQALPADLETVLDILEEGAQWLASRVCCELYGL